MAEGKPGQPWTDDEVRIALDAYFRMLRWQLARRDFVKADVRADVAPDLPARSKKSIELKWCNVSAVLDEMELPWVEGYRPLSNYQRSLVAAVEGGWRTIRRFWRLCVADGTIRVNVTPDRYVARHAGRHRIPALGFSSRLRESSGSTR